jgi:putative oxidoreductase
LQRLYSTFARGWPGMGLLLLRLGTGIPLIYFAIGGLPGAESREPASFVLDGLGAIVGLLLIIGLWTPVVGAVVAVTQLWVLFSRPFSTHPYPFLHLFLALLGAALAMLGPGAWSIDAHVFGRKRLIP